MTQEEKERSIAQHFQEIIKILGVDISKNPSLKNTPKRVAKMYVQELFWGLNPDLKPNLSLFENEEEGEVVLEKNITLYSTCEHHFLPIIGKAHVAYVPQKKIIGLSKINRLVNFVARRPQLQERMTSEICHQMMELLQTPDVACLIEADHLCVRSRGIQDGSSQTTTWKLFGKFKEAPLRADFFNALG